MTLLNVTPVRLMLASGACGLLFVSGCASAPAAKTASTPPASVSAPAAAPSAKQLEDCPCGNPDWARLPPGSLEPPGAQGPEEPDDSAPAEP